MNGSIFSSDNKLVRSASVPAERLKQIDGIFIASLQTFLRNVGGIPWLLSKPRRGFLIIAIRDSTVFSHDPAIDGLKKVTRSVKHPFK
jgi:hypothetical protein